MRHHRTRLTGIGHFSRDKIIEAARDAVRDRAHQIGSIVDRQLAPRPLLRRTRGLNRRVDFCATALGDMAKQRAVMRLIFGKTLARRAVDKRAADEMPEVCHLNLLRRRGVGAGIARHLSFENCRNILLRHLRHLSTPAARGLLPCTRSLGSLLVLTKLDAT